MICRLDSTGWVNAESASIKILVFLCLSEGGESLLPRASETTQNSEARQPLATGYERTPADPCWLRQPWSWNPTIQQQWQRWCRQPSGRAPGHGPSLFPSRSRHYPARRLCDSTMRQQPWESVLSHVGQICGNESP